MIAALRVELGRKLPDLPRDAAPAQAARLALGVECREQGGDVEVRPACYQCTPLVSVAIAICSKEARSSTSAWPLEAAESGNTR